MAPRDEENTNKGWDGVTLIPMALAYSNDDMRKETESNVAGQERRLLKVVRRDFSSRNDRPTDQGQVPAVTMASKGRKGPTVTVLAVYDM